MKKTLTSIIAAGALLALVVPGAQATFDRSVPAKAPQAKVGKVAHKTHLTARSAKSHGSFIEPGSTSDFDTYNFQEPTGVYSSYGNLA